MNPRATTSDRTNAKTALDRVTRALLSKLNESGYWTGELSSSALSTAVATIALGEMSRHAGTTKDGRLVEGGLHWLANHANADGGWGDTVLSRSNLSTTALVWAAFGAAGKDERFAPVVQRAERWMSNTTGSLDHLVPSIEGAYGKDRTFSVPIIMTLALSGRLGANGWRQVRPLPFELAMCPRSWFGALRLPVVSYALPALIAIGQTIHHHSPSANPLVRALRNLSRARTLQTLETLQPANGGFLEATPLTSFVTMSLAAMGHGRSPVAERGAAFLRHSVRPDGSWPIDTNLATWVTTLSVKALRQQPDALDIQQKQRLRDWLLAQQYRVVHPYTGAAPGGWAWTHLPGGVPDADDTAGALLALRQLGVPDTPTLKAAEAGVRWLLNLQNRDGGIPTFCRGWGALPFDRSTPELTAHTLRAWVAWRPLVDAGTRARIDEAQPRALGFLRASQRADGAWIPLWFGNEHAIGQENPVYGTAQVLTGLNEIEAGGVAVDDTLRRRAGRFLLDRQNPDGGWGGDKGAPTTIEETALVLEALVQSPEQGALEPGWQLLESVAVEDRHRPAPIGLYFAKLWYYERLYPLIFLTGALGRYVSEQR